MIWNRRGCVRVTLGARPTGDNSFRERERFRYGGYGRGMLGGGGGGGGRGVTITIHSQVVTSPEMNREEADRPTDGLTDY